MNELNSICRDCLRLASGSCKGTENPAWTGCIYRATGQEKDVTVKKCHVFHVYKQGGRYCLDLYRPWYPIHSYATLQGVAETLYYSDIIPEKTVAALMSF